MVDLNISLDEFVTVSNELKEYDDMEKDIKNDNDKRSLKHI